MSVGRQKAYLYAARFEGRDGFVELGEDNRPLTFYDREGSKRPAPGRFTLVRYRGSYPRLMEAEFRRLVAS